MAAALYTSSSVLAARKVSRGNVPSKAAPSSIKDKTRLLTARQKRDESLFSLRNFLSVSMPPPQPAQPPSLDESIATFEVVGGVCTNTPKSTFALGDTVCAQASNAPLRSPTALRRFNWGDTAGFILQSEDVVADPDTNLFTLPASNTSIVDGVTIDNRGTWTVSLNSADDNTTRAIAYFTVSDPANLSADLVVYNFSTTGDPITPGTNTGFFLWLSNAGPDPAANVHLTMAVPPNMSYLSATTTSAFTCAENAGVVDCSVASWASAAVATITLNFSVSNSAPNGVTSSTASISSDTFDPRTASNTSDAQVEIRAAGSPPATCALICPGDITVTANANQGGPGAFVTFTGSVEVSGDCGTVQFLPASGSFFSAGSPHQVSVTSSTGGGSCSFTVTVIDTPAPTISCPSDVTTQAASGQAEVSVSTGTPTATGTGVSVSGSRSDNRDVTDSYPIGTTTIIWTATDSDGRTASCTQHVTVTSADAPTITCPTDRTFTAAAGECQKTVLAEDIGLPSTGGTNVTVTNERSDGLNLTAPYPAGDTFITWTATNALGSASCTQKIHINAVDNEPPALTVPPDVSATTNTCSALLDDELGVATATDNCSSSVNIKRTGVPLTACSLPNVCPIACPTQSDPGRTCFENFNFPVGTTDVTYTATDAAGNVTTGVQHVTVHEPTPPTFTFVPGNVGPVFTGPGATSCGAFVSDATLGTAIVADNCDATVIRSGVPAGNNFPVGVTIITYTAKADLTVTATQTVTVVDNTPPVVTPPGAVTLFTGPGATSCGVTVSNLDATLGTGSATDNCPGVGPVTRSGVPAGNFFPVGPTTLTYSATDAHTNTGSANQLVTVVDNTPPTITCQANIIADFDPAVNGAVVTYTAPVGTDNCPSTTTQIAGLPSGSTFPVGTTTNTFKVTDGAGLTATCSFKVTVALTSIIGLDSASLSGSALVDSYDSTGGYPATKGSLANLLSNGTITVGGSGKVFGNVRSTRVGVNLTGSAQVTGNATAGTTVTKAASAIVGGTITNNALAPFMTLPSVPACGPPYSPNSGISGTYSYNASTGDLTLSGINSATLANGNYCFHNVTLTNSGQLKVNGLVTIKLTGTLSTSGATSLPNTTLIPSNLRILSSYSGSNGVTFGNSSSLQLVVYAPNTNVTISGSAPLFGTVVGKTVTVSNSGMIHYDTQLKSIWPDVWTLIFGP
jgi:uncharacterized repeat protein (TIGR01451 family)